jgi:hypothetical protein
VGAWIERTKDKKMRIEKINDISECAEIQESDFPLWEKLGYRKATPKTKLIIASEKVHFVNIGLGEPYKVDTDVPLGQQILTGQLLKEVPIEEPVQEPQLERIFRRKRKKDSNESQDNS